MNVEEHTSAPAPVPVQRLPVPRRRILLIEVHPIVSKGLSTLVNQQDDLELCGSATDETSALEKLAALQPDLVLLGAVRRPQGELELLNTIRAKYPSQHVLIVSAHDETLFAPKAIRGGASGYVMMREPTATLLSAIRRVLEGKTFISPRLMGGLRRSSAETGAGLFVDPVRSLTEREHQIFLLLGDGRSPRSIASELRISAKTVDAHRTRIKTKLGLRSAADVLRAAREARSQESREEIGS